MVQIEEKHQLVGSRDGVTQLQRSWRSSGSSGPAHTSTLIVHGMSEHSGRYRRVGQYLAARGHDVLAYDLRGHGQSGGNRGYVDSFSQFLDDLEDLIIERRQLNLPVLVIAHSLGGLIASTYLVDGRHAPDYLVLSAPALGAPLALWQRVAAPALSRIAPKKVVPLPHDASRLTRDQEQQRAYTNDPLRLPGITGRLANEMFTAMRTTSPVVDRITVPTYVLHGSDDPVVPIEHTAPLAALPNVTYKRWDGLRHECFNERQYRDVLNELSAWFERSSGSTSSPDPTSRPTGVEG